MRSSGPSHFPAAVLARAYHYPLGARLLLPVRNRSNLEMTKRAGRFSSRLSLRKPCLSKTCLLRRGAAIFLLAGLFAALSAPWRADEPKPDPSGISTGDKTSAVDAAGNSFVVT